ncbi:hypothetical protein FIBSPDRAFT_732273 [Athelia psychrophila]|uniref:Uncharacterized protein n=1 Tax=Athelia psychrophila TaxID=1759441 RepID=A0A166PUF2_9AGAM|nr:hypothetical protein FIBSPDRAFT_732273 [Fibularhizoctonia sp. CBS 109695]
MCFKLQDADANADTALNRDQNHDGVDSNHTSPPAEPETVLRTPLPSHSPPPSPSPPPDPVPPHEESDIGGDEPEPAAFEPQLKEMEIALEYIKALENASLNSTIEPLDEDFIHRIRNPPTTVLTIDNPDHRLSLDIFLAITNASEAVYNSVRAALLRRNPESEILTYYKVKQMVADLSGVTPILRDMCVNSCIGYTGPYSEATVCPHCQEERYTVTSTETNKIPRKQFYTIPLAPQLQALWGTPQGARNMGYRQRCTEQIMADLQANSGHKSLPYKDFFDGSDYLRAVDDDKIASGDTILMLSIDGAQLYRNKISECWIYIWVVLDHSPDVRFKKKHVLPGGFIPGPGKPKNSDTFLFTGLHHLAAIQKEGLWVWDADRNRKFKSFPFLALATADGPGMACINGFVGHHGRCHCRLYCPLVGRHKPGASHYYPARQKPQDYEVAGCNHDDVNLDTLLKNFTPAEARARYLRNLAYVVNSGSKHVYEQRRLETGICKPTIFSGLPTDRILGIPGCFGLDIMHLAALNIPDLFIPLWRGTFDCEGTDDKAFWPWAVLARRSAWTAHGKMVSDTTQYIPGSFDRPPRDPAKKISSGYKAWEFLLYFYGLGPCLFYGVLPDIYWIHYCKLVRGIKILMQEVIHPLELLEARRLLNEFSDGFEQLYVQRKVDRLHFVQASMHTISHLAAETARVGPLLLSGQFVIERTIGTIGEEIKQHSNAFVNFEERGLRRCQINALKALIPDIEVDSDRLPHSARDLGDGFAFRTAKDNTCRPVADCEKEAIQAFLNEAGEQLEADWEPQVIRWARLSLPNGQIARSRWKEEKREVLRMARNVKIIDSQGKSSLGEVHFYMWLSVHGVRVPVAMISNYGPPDATLYQASSRTYTTFQHFRDVSVRVIPVKAIQSVVMIAPDQMYSRRHNDGSEQDRYYLMEKPGAKLSGMVGLQELDNVT